MICGLNKTNMQPVPRTSHSIFLTMATMPNTVAFLTVDPEIYLYLFVFFYCTKFHWKKNRRYLCMPI